MIDADDDWPCCYCREPRRACGCDAAMSCSECGEFWQHCSCHAPSVDEPDEVQHAR